MAKTLNRIAFACALAVISFSVWGCERRESAPAPPPPAPKSLREATGPVKVRVADTMAELLAEEDTDSDDRITVEDKQVEMSGRPEPGITRGDKYFSFSDLDGNEWSVSSAYYLSNLLQELAWAKERGDETAELSPGRVYENPVGRISRLIREKYWDNLTRAVDEEHMPGVLYDDKTTTKDGMNYLYVPYYDKRALDYYNDVATRHPEWNMKIVRLPQKITPEYVRGLDGRHGLLSLALVEDKDGKLHGAPYVVPGGRFNEMYGWDSYFIVLGLLADDRVDLAKSMVDNHVYQIEHYGKILNANRTYYLTRSQPPFLTSMALAVYNKLPQTEESHRWYGHVLRAAIKEYETVWASKPRLTESGLSRYYGEGIGPCPEVEPGHYDYIVRPYAKKLGLAPDEYLEEYKSGQIKEPELDTFFIHDRAVRESGHDTTYRFDNRTADFLPVDLNSLLGKYEIDLFAASGDTAWQKRYEKRVAAMDRLMWDSDRGGFFDYDMKNERRSGYGSATALYPLWAGLANKEQAASIVKNIVPLLEEPGGLAASDEASRGPITEDRPQRQWDYPNGWAPHQMLAWQGLRNYGYDGEANRLTYKWLYTIARNAADYNMTVPEKYDVVKRTHLVFAEYGNVGTKFSYITKEGFGWMNASFQVGLRSLPPKLVQELRTLTPPEEIFKSAD